MYDIRQVTNFSSEVISAPTRTVTVYIGNQRYITVTYYVLDLSRLAGSSGTPINKIGYICEPKANDYPIILTIGGQQRVISIGKTGIYEIMPETFSDINIGGAEVLECTPEVTEIRVPKGQTRSETVKFILDYVFSIN